MYLFLIIISSILIHSCFLSNNDSVLSGKIATRNNDSCITLDLLNNNKCNFKIPNKKNVQYGIFRWANTTDHLVTIEYSERSGVGIFRGSVITFNQAGEKINTLFEAKDGEIAGDAHLSKNDKFLLFSFEFVSFQNTDPLNGLIGQKSIYVMDFEKKMIIKKLENVGWSPNFQLNESPWFINEKQFVYSIDYNKKYILQGTEINNQIKKAGIYIYDILTNENKLLVPNGYFGICSPKDYKLGYIKDNNIWTLDLNYNKDELMYQGKSNEKIINIHWTPDGKYIYVASVLNSPTESHDYTEKLLEISTKKEIKISDRGFGFNSYTWK